jgi:hypothetical protein
MVFLRVSAAQKGCIRALADGMRAAISELNVGVFDGDDFGSDECTLFLYGPDADRLFQAIWPPLSASPLARRLYN